MSIELAQPKRVPQPYAANLGTLDKVGLLRGLMIVLLQAIARPCPVRYHHYDSLNIFYF